MFYRMYEGVGRCDGLGPTEGRSRPFAIAQVSSEFVNYVMDHSLLLFSHHPHLHMTSFVIIMISLLQGKLIPTDRLILKRLRCL